ncbi:hypothetical protein PGTUg99_033904 [Puccinia graminis f. sp. tritici]|uniref:Uncharacterized protein n=1 Tax=Puccinia graminis f. sp. tritici TaxID=56615 RepID=A0A5B0QUZ8_PUCGR|nr:hypothetical protein PGTUg99_033904 [Puccinia graminis f. sp. tritici]
MDDGDIGSSEFTGLDPPQAVDSDSEDPELASRAIQREKLIKEITGLQQDLKACKELEDFPSDLGASQFPI